MEYYFKGDNKYLAFPWANGTAIENIAQYYADYGFMDWLHPDSGAPMIKRQHPEYELFTAGSANDTSTRRIMPLLLQVCGEVVSFR